MLGSTRNTDVRFVIIERWSNYRKPCEGKRRRRTTEKEENLSLATNLAIERVAIAKAFRQVARKFRLFPFPFDTQLRNISFVTRIQ